MTVSAAADDAGSAAGRPVADAASARCRNCDCVAPGRYCPACGQSTALHPPTVVEFVHEFVGHYVALEGPLWRTLAALLLTPGRLTVEYFAGRRQRYVAPLRLYLTASLILFALTGLQGAGLRIGNETFEYRLPREVGIDRALPPSIAPDRSHDGGFFDRAASRIDAMTLDERSARINAAVRQYLPYVLIVLVPVLALLLKLVYWNRALRYGEHLVVAFHAQTVAFVFAIVSALPLGDLLGGLLVILLVVHGAVALRRVYGGHWIATVVRECALLMAYSVVVGIALAALATLSLAL